MYYSCSLIYYHFLISYDQLIFCVSPRPAMHLPEHREEGMKSSRPKISSPVENEDGAARYYLLASLGLRELFAHIQRPSGVNPICTSSACPRSISPRGSSSHPPRAPPHKTAQSRGIQSADNSCRPVYVLEEKNSFKSQNSSSLLRTTLSLRRLSLASSPQSGSSAGIFTRTSSPLFYRSTNIGILPVRLYRDISPSNPRSDRNSADLSSDWSSDLGGRLDSPSSNLESASFVIDTISSSPPGVGETESRASREDWCRIIRTAAVDSEEQGTTEDSGIDCESEDRISSSNDV